LWQVPEPADGTVHTVISTGGFGVTVTAVAVQYPCEMTCAGEATPPVRGASGVKQVGGAMFTMVASEQSGWP
jgi:hypothetical protein